MPSRIFSRKNKWISNYYNASFSYPSPTQVGDAKYVQRDEDQALGHAYSVFSSDGTVIIMIVKLFELSSIMDGESSDEISVKRFWWHSEFPQRIKSSRAESVLRFFLPHHVARLSKFFLANMYDMESSGRGGVTSAFILLFPSTLDETLHA